MSERTLTLDIEDNIAKITMNKPERKNALDKEMINLWVSALDECKESKEVKASILTGAGDAFCAGLMLDTAESGDVGEKGVRLGFEAATAQLLR